MCYRFGHADRTLFLELSKETTYTLDVYNLKRCTLPLPSVFWPSSFLFAGSMLLHICFISPITRRDGSISNHGGHYLESAQKGEFPILPAEQQNPAGKVSRHENTLLQLAISSCASWLHWMPCDWVFRRANNRLAPSASRVEWRPSSRRCGRSWRNPSTIRSSPGLMYVMK